MNFQRLHSEFGEKKIIFHEPKRKLKIFRNQFKQFTFQFLSFLARVFRIGITKYKSMKAALKRKISLKKSVNSKE